MLKMRRDVHGGAPQRRIGDVVLPPQFTLEEERDMSHYTITSKNDVTNTFPEVRHRQRLERLAVRRIRARDGLHLAVGREE